MAIQYVIQNIILSLILCARIVSALDTPVREDGSFHRDLMQVISYNVQAYGAKGDGITDDTVALSSILASNRRIYFPPGTYKITSRILLHDLTNVVLEGTTGAIIHQVTSNTAGIVISGNSTDITIIGLTIQGGNPGIPIVGANGDGIGVGAEGALTTDARRRITIRRNTVSGFSHMGIGIVGSNSNGGANLSQNFDIQIIENIITDCAIGVFSYKGTHGLLIHGNVIREMWRDGIALDTKSAGDAQVAVPSDNIVVANNVIIDTASIVSDSIAVGILAKGAISNLAITGNIIQNIGLVAADAGIGSFGILVENTPDLNKAVNVTIAANSINNIRRNAAAGNAAYGINVSATDHVAVTGNTIRGVDDFGMRFQDSQILSIIGNTVADVGLYAVYITGTDIAKSGPIVFSGNMLLKGAGAATVGLLSNVISGLTLAANYVDPLFTTPKAVSYANGVGINDQGIIYTTVLPITLANSPTETTVLTVPIAAGTLVTGKKLRIFVIATSFNNTIGDSQITVRAKLDGTLFASGVFTMAPTIANKSIVVQAELLATGNTVQWTDTAMSYLPSNTATGASPTIVKSAFVTIKDMTTSVNMTLTVQHEIADADINFVLRSAHVVVE